MATGFPVRRDLRFGKEAAAFGKSLRGDILVMGSTSPVMGPALVLRGEAGSLLDVLIALRAAGFSDHFNDPEDVFTVKYREHRMASGALELTMVFEPSDRLLRSLAAVRAAEPEARSQR